MTSGRCDASLFNRSVRRIDNDPNGSTTLLTLLTFLDFDGEHTLETLGPSERDPVSSRPLVSGFPVLLLAFVERRLHAVCCCIREQYLEFFDRHVGKQNHDVELAELVWAFLKDKNR